ncbi:PQQ-dependent sugar dehydrogenase [Azohydromonas lata]|uniref:PQQ-dependent sugar dehydrogenase n=1 Tax=Azohydromonas lata TaxID=45677 RepID=A0ABU5IH94_9BURK|nr:PQQ-dependent sugar dehydrogenase [Azohydromonas lata]MDZ5457308.1 PQQ-dependent sugar dehydrogenase [Azohydromonas lata]
MQFFEKNVVEVLMREQQCAGEPARAANLSRRGALGRLAGWGGVAGLGGASALLAGCGGGDGGMAESPAALESAAQVADTAASAEAAALPAARVVRAGLNHPWGLDFLGDGSLLVTERAGRLRRISADGSSMSSISGLPPRIFVGGQGGLLDVIVEHLGGDTWVYLSYTERGTGPQYNTAGLAVARARLVAGALRDLAVIFRASPKVAVSNMSNYGGRMALAGTKLFVSLGDHFTDAERIRAQWLGAHHGKIVRINRNGSVPADNPFVGQPGALPEIWSRGHRNPQGLTFNPFTGELWSSEHGPQGGDEINVIERGQNYGWPRISYGCEYGTTVGACTVVGGKRELTGMEQPQTWWVPTSIAPSGISFYDGAMFPEWRGNLFVAALKDTSLWRLTLSGRKVVSRSALYRGLGRRMRHVRQAPDGALLVLTDEDNGRILRIAR